MVMKLSSIPVVFLLLMCPLLVTDEWVVASATPAPPQTIVIEAESFPVIVRAQGDKDKKDKLDWYPTVDRTRTVALASGTRTVSFSPKLFEKGKEGYIEYTTESLPNMTWYLWMRATTTSEGTSTGFKLYVNGEDKGLFRKSSKGVYTWQRYTLDNFSGGALRIVRYRDLCNGGWGQVDVFVLTNTQDFNPTDQAESTSSNRPAAADQTVGPRLIKGSTIPSEPLFTGSTEANDPYLYGEPFYYSPWLASLPENMPENNFKYGMTGSLAICWPISDGVSVRNLPQHYYGINWFEHPGLSRRLDIHAEGGIRTSLSPHYIRQKNATLLTENIRLAERNIAPALNFIWRAEMAVIGALDLFNEPSANVPLDDVYTKYFQEWLMEKYGSLQQLNADWGTYYISMTDIPQPDPDMPIDLADRARWLSWMQFRAWTLLKRHEDAFAVARKSQLMGLPILTTEILIHHSYGQKSFIGQIGPAWKGWDIEALSAIQDVNGMHKYNLPVPDTIYNTKLFSGLGSGKPIWNYETGYNNFYLPIWAYIGSGVRAVQIFQALDYPGATGFGKFNDRHFTKDEKLILRPRNDAFIYGDMGFEIKRWGALYNSAAVSEPSDVAILHPWITMQQNPDDPTPLTEQYGIFQSLLKDNIPATIISETMIKQGVLSDYKMLCLPTAVNLEPEVAAAIAKWVENGGYLLATSRSSRYDHYYRGDTFQLGDVFGCSESSFAEIESSYRMTLASNMPLKEWASLAGHSVNNRVIDMRFYSELSPHPGASVVLQNPNGSAAAIFNKSGKGASLYIGANLGMMYHFADSSGYSIDLDFNPKEEAQRLRLLITGMARAAGVQPKNRIASLDGNPSPVVITRQDSPSATMVFVFPYEKRIPEGYLLSVDVSHPVVGVYQVPIGTQGSRILNPITWKRNGDSIESVLTEINNGAMIVIAHDYQPVVSLQVSDTNGIPITWHDTIEEGAELVLKLAIDNLGVHSIAGRVYAESQLWPDRPGFNFIDVKPGERAEAEVKVIVGDITPHDIRPLVVADDVYRYIIEGRAFISQPSTALTLPASVGVSVKDVGVNISPVKARVLTRIGETALSRIHYPYDKQRVNPNANSYTFKHLDLATATQYVGNMHTLSSGSSNSVKVVSWDATTKTVTFDKPYPGLIDQLLQADYRKIPAREPSEIVK